MTTPTSSVSWLTLCQWQYLPKLLVLALAIWLHAANSMMTATIMPSAVKSIGGVELISWAFSLYLAGAITAASAVSVLVNRYGLRRALLNAALVHLVGSFICMTAPLMPVLLVGRTVQGLGGGALVALVFVAQSRLFPNHFALRVVALLSLVWTFSAFLGPAVGGFFATYGIWRFAFAAFIAQAVLLYAAVSVLLKKGESGVSLTEQPIPFVRLGLVTGAVLLIASAGYLSRPLPSALMTVGGFLLLALFIYRDRRVSISRLLPIQAASLAHPVGSGIAMTFLLSLCCMSFLVYGPILLIELYGLTPLEAGFVLVMESVGWGMGALLLSSAPVSWERITIRCGSLLIICGVAAQAWFLPHGPLWAVVITAFIGNSGFGVIWGFIIKNVVSHADAADKDRAAAILPTTIQTGFAVGAALAGLIANSLAFAELSSHAEFAHAAFWLFAGFLPVALLGYALAWRFSAQITPEEQRG